ncbi:MAG: DUF6798 domain-containing protein [Candidatus Altiarchaeota archaeon]
MGLAFNIQGINTLTVFTGLSLACLATTKDLRKLAACVFFFVLFASPLLVWRMLESPGSQSLFQASPHWLELVRARNSSSFPSTWSREAYFTVFFTFAVFLLSARHMPDERYHRTVVWFVRAIAVMMAGGFVFNELIPLTISFSLTTFRAFRFLQYFTVIYFSNHLVRELEENRGMLMKLVSIVLGVWLFFGPRIVYQEYVASAAAVLLLAGLLAYKTSSGRIIRVDESHVICAATLVLTVFVAVNGLNTVALGNIQEEQWLNVQYWALEHTDKQDTFLTPPLKEGFRVESERPIYGDFMDGTLLHFNPDYGFEWEKRMNTINCIPAQWQDCNDNYNRLTEAEIKALSEEYGIRYVVTERKDLTLPKAYENSKYTVYRL